MGIVTCRLLNEKEIKEKNKCLLNDFEINLVENKEKSDEYRGRGGWRRSSFTLKRLDKLSHGFFAFDLYWNNVYCTLD